MQATAAADALKKKEDMAGVALFIAKKANTRCHPDDIGVVVIRLGATLQPSPAATISASPDAPAPPPASTPDSPSTPAAPSPPAAPIPATLAGAIIDAADAAAARGMLHSSLVSAGSVAAERVSAAGSAARHTPSCGPLHSRYSEHVSQDAIPRLVSMSVSSFAAPEADTIRVDAAITRLTFDGEPDVSAGVHQGVGVACEDDPAVAGRSGGEWFGRAVRWGVTLAAAAAGVAVVVCCRRRR